MHHHGAGSIDTVQGPASDSLVQHLLSEYSALGLDVSGAQIHQSDVYREVVMQSLLRPMNQIGDFWK